MTIAQARILVVDDEEVYRSIIKRVLVGNGFEVLMAQDGEEAVRLTASEKPDLLILDIMMPVMDGFEACRKIRSFSSVPVIMLSARIEDQNKIKGLDVGADDYVTKPFNPYELLAHVKAILRRVELDKKTSESPIFQLGALRVDLIKRRVFVNDLEIKLTLVEYKVLIELIERVGQLIPSRDLAQAVWGYNSPEDVTVRQAIYRLRHKLEPDPGHPIFIQSQPGRGYMLNRPEENNQVML
jgi:two-component system response regulator VicR